MYLHVSTSVCVKMHNHVMQGCRQGGRGWGEFKLMLLCVQAVTAKGHPNFILIENKRGNNSFQCMLHIQKSKPRSVQIYEFALVMCTNSILGAKLSTPLSCMLCMNNQQTTSPCCMQSHPLRRTHMHALCIAYSSMAVAKDLINDLLF